MCPFCFCEEKKKKEDVLRRCPQDVASLVPFCKETAGELHYYPGFTANTRGGVGGGGLMMGVEIGWWSKWHGVKT